MTIRDMHAGRYDLEAMGARGRAYVTEDADTRVALGRYRELLREMVLMRKVFWGSLAALAWTHVGYPAAAAVAARVAPRPVRREDILPTVTVIVAAHNEEDVIAPRREPPRTRLPAELVEIVVASDASTDRTHEIVREIAAREPRVSLLECPRGGKVAAQNLAVAQSDADVVAFSDANATWAPDALRKLVRAFADPDVAYCCGRLVLEAADGTNVEGVYWRMETWLREQESETGSLTGGYGSIYAVGAPTTPTSIRASATTFRSRTSWCSAAGARCTTGRRSRSRSRRPTSRTSTGARCGCSSTAGSCSTRAGCSRTCRPGTS